MTSRNEKRKRHGTHAQPHAQPQANVQSTVSTNISCRGFEETLCHPSQEACADQLQLEPARLHLERQTLAHSDAFRRIPTLSICI